MSKNKLRLPEVEEWLENVIENINPFLILCYVAGIALTLIVADWLGVVFPAFSEGMITLATRAAGEIVTLTFFVVLISVGAIFVNVLLGLLYFVCDALQMVVEYRKQEKNKNE